MALNVLKHLFWKTQLSMLRACPQLLGIVSGFTMNAYKSRALFIKTLFHTAAQAPHIVFCYCRDKWKGRIVMPLLSISITTRCTLNCDKCGGHIPDFKTHEDVPTSEIERDIYTLLSCVDHIYAVVISGGEAFMHPDLDKII